jgi:hypothetical protein
MLSWLGAAGMLVALGCWALASPVGSSPDEDYHLASIWCSHGFSAGVCEPGSTAGTRAVPEALITANCYKFQAATSATCQTSQLTGAGMVDTDRVNEITNGYPPVFYWVHGFLVSDNVGASVLLMRLVNVLLFLGLIAAVYALVPAGLRRALIGGALITAVPLGIFLAASINPSGWAMLSAIALPVALLGFLTATDRRRRYALGGLAAFALLIGAGARADAASYAIVAIAVAVILAVRIRLDVRTLRRLSLPAVLAVGAAFAFLAAGQSAAIGGNPTLRRPPFSLGRLINTAIDVPSLWPGGLGGWGLGWLDVTMPGIVWVASWSVFAAVVFVAVSRAGIRQWLATGLVAAAAVLVPTYLLFIDGSKVGAFVQPRYILPLLAMLVVTVMVRLNGDAFRLTGGQRWIVVGLLTVANAIALHTNIARYTVGVDGASWDLDGRIEWWWHIPITPMMTWLIGAMGFAIGVILLTREFVVAANATDTGPAVAHPPADDESASGGLLALDARTRLVDRTGDSVPAAATQL